MKLDHNCVRDLLLYIEKNLPYGYSLNINETVIDNYTSEELLYTSEKLIEADFLVGEIRTFVDTTIPNIQIHSITWTGHQFLDNIRDDGVWKETKNIVGKFSSVSLGILSNVAAQVITTLIQSQLGL